MSLQDELFNALKSRFPHGKIALDYDGKLLVVSIEDQQFKGLSKVKQQQLVYEVLNPWIVDKTIHAVKLNLSL